MVLQINHKQKKYNFKNKNNNIFIEFKKTAYLNEDEMGFYTRLLFKSLH